MDVHGWTLRWLVAAIGLIGIAGCGDSGADGTKVRSATPTPSNEPPGVFVTRLAKLLETTESKRQCDQLNGISVRSVMRFQCPPAEPVRKGMAGFRIAGSESFGTGGVVDYEAKSVEDTATAVLFVEPQRRWSVITLVGTGDRSVGTSDKENREGFDRTVDAYLEAVRTRDCKAFNASALTEGNAKEVCATEFATTTPLASLLKRAPKAEPAYMGGNSAFGFYSLEMKVAPPKAKRSKGSKKSQEPAPKRVAVNLTIAVGKVETKSGPSFLVLGVGSSPTAAEQRTKPKSQDQPDRSKSRKADS
jgi:hypothetical protein